MRIQHDSIAFMVLLGLFAGLPALSIDLSAPTLTLLPSALGTDMTMAGLTLTLFMLGFAAGLVIGGHFSDARGRRPTLIVALILYSLGGVCCLYATTGPDLVWARALQGLGAGACAVQAPAVVQDLFDGQAARRRQSEVTLVLTVVPLLAPILGAKLVQLWGWRSVHGVLAVGGIALLVLVLALFRETRRREVSRSLGMGAVGRMLGHLPFRRVVMANALSYGCVFAYISGSPGVVMGQLGQSADVFAAVFAATALSLTAGTFTNLVLDRKGLASPQIVRPGLQLQCGMTLLMVLTGLHLEGPWRALVLALLTVSCFARGIVSPNMTHMAVAAFRDQPGVAASLLGLLQLIAGALASAIVAAALPYVGYLGVALTMAGSAGAALLIWQTWVERVDTIGA